MVVEKILNYPSGYRNIQTHINQGKIEATDTRNGIKKEIKL